MRYGSVCSGIEAATAAWHHMGWKPVFFSEIEAFPRAVLEHRYPEVPLHGDFTTIEQNQYGKIDLLVGGTPCQSFSIAGLRGGLDDERGNLALEFCRLAQREQPRWIVWENVPGVLSSSGGRDFGSILGALEDLGYGLAYRVLDAQYFGVAQRRRRVFVVGYLGDWRPAAAVLFERHSMSGHPAPSREARKEAAGAAATGAGERGNGGRERSDLVGTLSCNTGPNGRDAGNFACNQAVDAGHIVVAGPLTAGMHKGPRGTESVESNHVVAVNPVPFDTTQLTSPYNYSNPQVGDPCHPLAAGAHPPAIAFSSKDYGADATEDCSPTLRAGGFTNSHQNGGVMPAIAYPINTQLGLRGEDTSNSTREGVGVGDEDDPPFTLQRAHSHAVAYSIMPMNSGKDYKARETEVAQPLMAAGPVGGNQGGDFVAQPRALAFDIMGTPATQVAKETSVHTPLRSRTPGQFENSTTTVIAPQKSAIRRLTPVECERLQGFPDGFTAIPWRKKGAEDCPDGPRYKALGNSMAVPVMRWIGERIQMVDDLVSVL